MADPPPSGDRAGRGSSGKVKGTLLIARMKYVRAQGRAAVDAVLGQLAEGDQSVLQGILLPSTWYSSDLLLRLEGAISNTLARGDRARALAEMGRFSAQANLGPGGVQRPYLRAGEPHHLLERVPRMYVSQHTTGRRAYERTGDRSAVIRSFGDDAVPDDCLIVVGWLQRAIELSGGVEVRVAETQCRMRGAPHCEYHAEWA